MRRTQPKQTFKLRFLAFVLALAIAWYSVNPAPATISQIKRRDELPDEKKRNFEPGTVPRALPLALMPACEMAASSLSYNENGDDFEWPEYIDG